MKTINTQTLFKNISLAAVLVLSLVPCFSKAAYSADEAVCVFVSQEGNAWVIRKDSTVKSTLNVGDAIYEGDNLVVTHGNTVQLAFDKEAKNVVQVDGDTSLKITGSKPAKIDLSQGRIFAMLDKKGVESQFKVFTPTAVAAVRGTHYQVNYINNISQVATYQGEVRVAGRDASGNEAGGYVYVSAGTKTSVDALGKAPIPAIDMTAAEKAEEGPVLANIERTKDWIQAQGADKLFEPTVAKKSDEISTSSIVKDKESEKKEDKKGLIVL